jgi:sec-independent protein translocase protein TatC
LQEEKNGTRDPRQDAAEQEVQPAAVTVSRAAVAPAPSSSGGGGGWFGAFRGLGGGGDDGGEDEEGMLRMSFLEHLEELRGRIIKSLIGIGVAFFLSLYFAPEMWKAVSDPAISALRQLGLQQKLVFITPTEAFMTIWMKLPLLAAIFLSSPWILYQVWAFIAPGLYRRERRWASPFVLCSAGLFILGGAFAYFLAFPFALTFLLGIGRDINVQPMVTVTEYFDLFVDVMLGIGMVFELPVLIFFLVLLRIASPAFLFRHSRYAILAIAILAAVVTPTPDVFNMMLFCVPMWMLFFVGIFAGYLLVLRREHRRFPWRKVLPWVGLALIVLAAAGWYFAGRYGYHIVGRWPFLSR